MVIDDINIMLETESAITGMGVLRYFDMHKNDDLIWFLNPIKNASQLLSFIVAFVYNKYDISYVEGYFYSMYPMSGGDGSTYLTIFIKWSLIIEYYADIFIICYIMS